MPPKWRPISSFSSAHKAWRACRACIARKFRTTRLRSSGRAGSGSCRARRALRLGFTRGVDHTSSEARSPFSSSQVRRSDARIGMDRRFAQLRRIHFAQPLEARHTDRALDLFALDAREQRVALAFVQAIKHMLADVDAEQR